jgi:hypothetical protein
MIKALSSAVLSALAMISIPATGFAQETPKPQENSGGCPGFNMLITKPDSNIDYKMRVIEADKDIDPKMVINPCPGGALALSIPSVPGRPNGGSGKTPGSAPPSKGFGKGNSNVTSSFEPKFFIIPDRLKSPSEVIKGYADSVGGKKTP